MTKRKSLVLTVVTYGVTLLLGVFLYYYFRDMGSTPFMSMLYTDIIMTAIVFSISIVINNSSMYDPYWSVIPIFIVMIWMVDLNAVNAYSIIALLGVLIWGIRLTRNWAIDFKGFGHEDFRYIDFRKTFGKLYWAISFLGIHLFPTLIVYISLAPILYLLSNTVEIVSFVYFGFVIMSTGAVISFVADAQLREHKQSGNKNSIMTGLWKYSRHPNYFGEVLFWLGVLVTSLAAGFDFINSIGFVGMLLLFNLYSVPKMESKLLNNKDDYQIVIDNVPRFFIRPKQSVTKEA